MSGVQFGSGEPLQWRTELEEEDADDEQIETSQDVIEILGFDPAEIDHLSGNGTGEKEESLSPF